MEIKNKDLKKRIIEISYKYNLSHIGSCLTAVDIINYIYTFKKPFEIFVLSSGHAGLALYVILEKYLGYNAEDLFKKHGVHPNRDIGNGIYVSTGSLGHGLGIATGFAHANRERKVYCLISDGEFSEGSIYEAYNIAKNLRLQNLFIYINCNGYGAYRRIYSYTIADQTLLYQTLNTKIFTTSFGLPFLEGLDAHYYQMKEEDYKLALKLLA